MHFCNIIHFKQLRFCFHIFHEPHLLYVYIVSSWITVEPIWYRVKENYRSYDEKNWKPEEKELLSLDEQHTHSSGILLNQVGVIKIVEKQIFWNVSQEMCISSNAREQFQNPSFATWRECWLWALAYINLSIILPAQLFCLMTRYFLSTWC